MAKVGSGVCDVLSIMLHNNVCCIISCYVSFVVATSCMLCAYNNDWIVGQRPSVSEL